MWLWASYLPLWFSAPSSIRWWIRTWCSGKKMRSGPQKMSEWMNEQSLFYTRNHRGKDTSNLFCIPSIPSRSQKMFELNQVRDLRALTVVESWYNHDQVPSILNLYFLICKMEVVIPSQIEWGGRKIESIKALGKQQSPAQMPAFSWAIHKDFLVSTTQGCSSREEQHLEFQMILFLQ